MTEAGLAGIKVVVTRPEKQAGALCKLIESQGGEAIRFATLDILEPEESGTITRLLDRLEMFDIAIFVSRNAVEGTAAHLQRPLPGTLQLMAVGQATRQAIEQQWPRRAVCPTAGSNSEALLETEQLKDVNGRKIIIFRGQGGRELLGDTLKNRGASVAYAEVYRRARPDRDLASLQASNVDLITATSNESLQNLFDMADAGQSEWLKSRQLIVISQRTAELARTLGFQHPARIAPSMDNQGLLDAMLAWHSQTQH